MGHKRPRGSPYLPPPLTGPPGLPPGSYTGSLSIHHTALRVFRPANSYTLPVNPSHCLLAFLLARTWAPCQSITLPCVYHTACQSITLPPGLPAGSYMGSLSIHHTGLLAFLLARTWAPLSHLAVSGLVGNPGKSQQPGRPRGPWDLSAAGEPAYIFLPLTGPPGLPSGSYMGSLFIHHTTLCSFLLKAPWMPSTGPLFFLSFLACFHTCSSFQGPHGPRLPVNQSHYCSLAPCQSITLLTGQTSWAKLHRAL